LSGLELHLKDRRKIKRLTTGLQDSFGTRATSYAACSPQTYGQLSKSPRRKLEPRGSDKHSGTANIRIKRCVARVS